ncbi:MAG: phosphoethanolamine transferase [Paludibacter sp.]|nr:phosphoethanolamine transferase [Paludibacter sp.]
MRNRINKSIIWIIILSLIVLLPNIYLAFYGSDLAGQFTKTIMFLGMSLLIFFIPALFLNWRYFFLFHGIFVILSPIEIVHITLNRLPVTYAFLMDIFSTNVSEAMGLFSSSLFYILLYFSVLIFFFIVSFTKIQKVKVFHNIKLKLIFVFLFVFYCIAGFVYYYKYNTYIVEDKDRLYSETIKTFSYKFHKIYPYDLIIQTHKLISINQEVKKAEKITNNFSFGAIQVDNSQQKEVYVFVIGETARYNNFSLNGYDRLTSPNLDKKSNLVSFDDFISEGNGTVISLPQILFRVDSENNQKAMYEKSFVDAFKEAGYKTYWIANQSGSYSFIRRIAKNTDESHITTTELGKSSNYDEDLLPFLDKILMKNDNKVLIVIHSSGSHFKYSDRYPKKFDVFQPNIGNLYKPSLISPKNKELFINAYDNSILYTDYFLSKIIDKIDSLDCVSSFVYLSDHGENLYDTEDNVMFHARTVITKYDYHVPLFIWYSNEYQNNYKRKIESLINNKRKPISVRYIFHSMLDMASITFPEQVLQKSIFSDKMQSDTIRYVINPNKERLIYENLPE